jgi:hypothetical protein
MHKGYRYLSTLLLAGAIATPVAMLAAPAPQDDRDRANRQSENNNKRYYDKKHKDYHTWDNNEDHAYQRYQTDHHQSRSFVQLNSRQQTVYWNWRHENPDQDHR